jgi:hypothetical protein
MSSASKLDEPATVIWFYAGPGTELSPSKSRNFDTQREAILFVMNLSSANRGGAMIHTQKEGIGLEEIERRYNEIQKSL